MKPATLLLHLLLPVLLAGPAMAAAALPPGWAEPLDAERLDTLRGGFDLVHNDLQLQGTVSANSASNIVTGYNSIAAGSFSNAHGIPMVVQNSGSNVLIQNATIINLQLR